LEKFYPERNFLKGYGIDFSGLFITADVELNVRFNGRVVLEKASRSAISPHYLQGWFSQNQPCCNLAYLPSKP
jgi:hypothetical protein